MFKARPAGPALPAEHDAHGESRPRYRGAAIVARALRAGSDLLARLVYLAVGVVVLIIGAGILLALLRANSANAVVSEVHGWGRWLTGPFDGMFSFHRARVGVAVNWGIAAIVYLLAAGLIARLISRVHNWRPVGRSPIRNQEDQ